MTNKQKRFRLLSILDQADALASEVMIRRGPDARRICKAHALILFAIEALTTDPENIDPPANPDEKPLPVVTLDCTQAGEPDGSKRQCKPTEPEPEPEPDRPPIEAIYGGWAVADALLIAAGWGSVLTGAQIQAVTPIAVEAITQAVYVIGRMEKPEKPAKKARKGRKKGT